jgi:hypothetical protein
LSLVVHRQLLQAGTAFASLLQFLSESPIAQIILLFVVLFIYG